MCEGDGMEEWKECKLGDICKTNINSYSEKDNWSFVNYLDTGNITENKISDIQFIDLSYESLPSRARRKVQLNDIIYSTVRPNQKHFGIIKNQPENFLVSTGFAVLHINKTFADPNFIFYNLIQNENTESLHAIAEQTTSAYPAIKPSDIENLSIKLPPLPTQQKIAAILSSLDGKIELNNKINTNLEQQAQALFKNWFVDFDPFGGKMPEGWKEAEFRDVCENITDGVHNTVVDDPNGEYLLLSCKNIKGGVLTISSSERKINKETFEKLRKRTKLAKGDILLSSVGTVGEMYLLNETPDNYEFQRSVAIIKPNTSLISPAFLYESMLSQKDTIIHSAHGAVQQCIFISDVGDFTTILPTIDIIEKFTKIVQPMLDTITANQHENQKLANIRDTLLPKLMNGEIEV